MARRDPFDFARFHVWTNDGKAPAGEYPIKPFPWDRPHIVHMIRLWQDNRRIAVVKSRQMMMTWLFCLLALWDAMFYSGRLIILQSKREDDAVGNEASGDGLLGRCKFIYNHLPRLGVPVPVARSTYNRLEFTALNSVLYAVPQGADIVRTHTISGLLSDESPLQPEFEEAHAATVPALGPDGWYVALGTPDLKDGGFFRRLVQDEPDIR